MISESGLGLYFVCLCFSQTRTTCLSLSRSVPLSPSHLPQLQACLESSEVNFRIAVGETIALLYELAREVNEVRHDRFHVHIST